MKNFPASSSWLLIRQSIRFGLKRGRLLLGLGLFLFPAFSSSTLACDLAADTTEPEPFKECDDQMSSLKECAVALNGPRAGGVRACEVARNADKEAVSSVKSAWKEICNVLNEMETKVARECAISHEKCHAADAEAAAKLKAATDKYRKMLSDRDKELAQAGEDLADEIERARAAAAQDDCRKGYDKGAEPDDGVKKKNINAIDLDSGALGRAAKGNTPVDADQFPRGLHSKQAQTINQIHRARERIKGEIARFDRASIAAGVRRNETDRRGKNLGDPKNTPSTITGDTKKNEMPAQGAGPIPQQSGQQPQKGGGKAESGPSGLTERSPAGKHPGERPKEEKGLPNEVVKLAAETPNSQNDHFPNPASNRTIAPKTKAGGEPTTRNGNTPSSLSAKVTGNLKQSNTDSKSAPATGVAAGDGGAKELASPTGESAANKKEEVQNGSASEGNLAGAGGGGSSGQSSSEENLTPFGKPLGDPKFSLAGSDNDAQIKQMVGDFGRNNSTRADGRSLASADIEDGIGDKNGPSLFERCHESHNRCQLKGCVTTHGGRKGG